MYKLMTLHVSIGGVVPKVQIAVDKRQEASYNKNVNDEGVLSIGSRRQFLFHGKEALLFHEAKAGITKG